MEGVTKSFDGVEVLHGITLHVPAGGFLGLLGRNGAGKSTTIRIAVGLLRPTAGRVSVLGLPQPAREVEIKRRIGVVGESLGLIERLTAIEHLRFLGRMRGLEERVIDERAAELLDLLEIRPDPGTLIGDYSYGTRKKVALAAALLHGPRLLFLDEPFEGIDPVTSRTIRSLLERLRLRGVALVLTSHVLEIVEKLCPTVAIIDAGRLVFVGELESLRRERGEGDLEALFVGLIGDARRGELSWL